MGRFSGSTAMVTGGAQGIGLGIAERFASEGAGVVILDIDPAAAESALSSLRAHGTPVRAVVGDVSRREDVRAAVVQCLEIGGSIDVLVAQAGIARMEAFLDLSDEEWQRVFEVNVNGVFIATQEAARAMRDRGGAIVVISSTNSFFVESDHTHYSASKGAVATFVRNAALDLGRYGIRVNAISPGIIRTRLSSHLIDHPTEGPAYLRQRVPLGRFGHPGDIAGVVAFLASEDASYMTGADVIVDGGATLGAIFEHGPSRSEDESQPASPPGSPAT